MKAKFVLLPVIVGYLFLYGCATAKGPLFKEVPLEVHKGKAVVYFYRNSDASRFDTFALRVNEGNTLPLQNKGYYMLILDPGAYNFKVSWRAKLDAENTFTLQGDKEYYIRFHIDIVDWERSLFGGTLPILGYGITSVPRDKAMEALKECRLIVGKRGKGGKGGKRGDTSNTVRRVICYDRLRDDMGRCRKKQQLFYCVVRGMGRDLGWKKGAVIPVGSKDEISL